MTVDLLTPILDGGIEHSHFFEGRLLSGRDLRDEQDANRLNRWQLGRAVGAGVVHGLKVSRGAGPGGAPLLTVEAGLAFNRKGQPLELHQRVDVRLLDSVGDVADDAGVFRNCPNTLATLVPSGIGLYLLVLSPASGYKESAPKSGLGEGGKASGCGKRYQVEGVSFRLQRIHPSEVSGISGETRDAVTTLLSSASTAGRSLLRNLAAHLCFGTEELAAAAAGGALGAAAAGADPASPSPYAEYGALDDLRSVGALTDCDVPVGLFHWSLSGLAFVDMWSVRRRVHAAAAGADLGTVLAARRRAEGEARLRQFQAHAEELRTSLGNPASVTGRAYFRWLPAAGLLTTSGPGGGYDAETFVSPLPHRGVLYLNGEQVPALFHRSMLHEAIDLQDAEMVWLYRPWQQEPALADGTASRAYVLFASGHLPPAATPRFDVARWDFSNYTTCCD